jgi:drug/metabolite transporter (DMT)-like permease
MPETKTFAGFGKTDGLLFLMAVIWGVNFSVVKFATGLMQPLAFTGLRVMLAAVVLLAFASVRKHKLPSRSDILSLIALGMLGNGIYQILFVEGIARTRVGNAALVIAATPALIAITSRFRGVDRVSQRVLAGIALSLLGVGIVVLGSAQSAKGTPTFFGTMLVFFGTLCWTAFTVMLQPYARRLDPVHLSAFTMLGGTIPLVIATSAAVVSTDWTTFGFQAWGAVLYASVLSMGVAYLFWYRGLRVLGPTRTAVYSNLQPVIAILVAWIFLSETPTVWQGVGTGTIITGLFLTRT